MLFCVALVAGILWSSSPPPPPPLRVSSEAARTSIRSLRWSRCRQPFHGETLKKLHAVLASAPQELRPYNRTVVAAANAYVHTRICQNRTSGQVFRPFLTTPARFGSCREEYQNRAIVGGSARPQCRVPGTSIYEPCPMVDKQGVISPGRFCDGFDVSADRNTRKTLLNQVSEAELRAAFDLPHIQVAMPEASIHADNINHYSRDLLFLTSIARHARALGWRVFAERPPAERRNEWVRGTLGALEAAGLIEPEGADVFDAQHQHHHPHHAAKSASAFCIARAAKIAYEGLASPQDVDELGCLVRAACGVRPAAKRTLLYVKRKDGGTRVVTNLPDALAVMQSFAERMGWELRVVLLGSLSFCEQAAAVNEAAVILGVHGADIANAHLARHDATLVEVYPLGSNLVAASAAGPWVADDTFYAVQMHKAHRRHLSVRLFEVDAKQGGLCNPNSTVSSDWQYRSDCSLRIELGRLRHVLDVLTELHAPDSVALD